MSRALQSAIPFVVRLVRGLAGAVFSFRHSIASRRKTTSNKRLQIDLETAPEDRLRDLGLMDGRPGRRGRADWE
ncbi:hypothetical protein D8780_09160 [Notoacmeibacter ruber]|uniref:DUF1127 domain-containing protein n=1 Tax=Notoacmeibacter ruber TaxID=2670375 RepID=A0A3L7JC82_9HYPH|nr:hypothetical protein D8780_09160 [Notoacmeibacter ruber]